MKGRRKGLQSVLVEPYRQVKLGLLFLIANIIFSVLIFGLFGYYIWDIYTTLSSYFEATPHQLSIFKFTWPLLAGFSLIILFVLLTLYISVRYTHEIYGPLVSIHRFLDSWSQGEQPEPLSLRESDQLKDLALKLNALAESHAPDRRESQLLAVHRFLDELLESKNPAPLKVRDSDGVTALAEKLNKLANRLG